MQDLSVLATTSIELLRGFLQPGEPTKGDLVKARFAMSSINAWTRAKASENAANRLTFTIVRSVTQDADELRRYLALAMPSAPGVRVLLPEKTE